MNIFEKGIRQLAHIGDIVIASVAPGLAVKRAQSRMLLDAYASGRSFDAATRGRRGKGWNAAGEGDPNADISRSLATLRERSRALYKNNPYARKAVRTIALNVVGTGIQPVPKATAPRNAKRAKEAWQAWAETTQCDFYGKKNIYGLQMLAMRTLALSGECIVVRKRDAAMQGPVKFRLQILEGDFLDAGKTSLVDSSASNYIVQGVEFDADGRRVAYWLYQRPPSNSTALEISSKRVPAEDVLHIFEEERPGQVRGVPFLVASMLRMRDFDDYEDAQLMRQKIAACFSVFVTQSPDPLAVQSSEIANRERVEPGIIERLSPGEQVTFASPPGAEGYADYSRKIQQGMAAGAGITYEQMSGDLSGVNFSSGRMGWIEAHRQVEDWQFNTFIPLFCDGIWAWMNQSLLASNLVGAYVQADWTPQGRFMIDPAKEIKGITAAMGAGIKSWSEAVREQGYDPDTLLEQMRQDAEKLKELGIPFEWLYGKQGAQGQPQQNAEE